MSYVLHTQTFFLKAKVCWYNLGLNRSVGWLIILICFILLFALLHVLKIPLKNDSRHPFLNIESKKRIQSEYILKAAAKFEKKTADMDTSKLSEKQGKKILIDMFNKADTNNDEKLDVKELTAVISEKVTKHLDAALKGNFFIFSAIDKNPRNGAISWEEYVRYFLQQNRFSPSEIEVYKSSLQDLPRDLRIKIMKDKAAFDEISMADSGVLSIDEFLSFSHPESSHSTILSYVEETLFKHDLNGDAMITEKEFSDPELNEEGLEGENLEKYRVGRIKEFREILDKNGNGKVDRNELVQYFDPRHIHHSQRDAQSIIGMADFDEDRVLSLSEVLMNKENFMNSKLINVAKSFHEEF